MTRKVLDDPSQLKPVSFCPRTVLLSVWMICNTGSAFHLQGWTLPALPA